MKEAMIIILITILMGCLVFFVINLVDRVHKDKQHIKVKRINCCQYRVNEYTNEVTHMEACDNLNHLAGSN